MVHHISHCCKAMLCVIASCCSIYQQCTSQGFLQQKLFEASIKAYINTEIFVAFHNEIEHNFVVIVLLRGKDPHCQKLKCTAQHFCSDIADVSPLFKSILYKLSVFLKIGCMWYRTNLGNIFHINILFLLILNFHSTGWKSFLLQQDPQQTKESSQHSDKSLDKFSKGKISY